MIVRDAVGKLMPISERSNGAMQQLLEVAQRFAGHRLDSSLEEYLAEGVQIEESGAIVSVAASRSTHAARGQFDDAVAFESFTNKIHLDDWGSDALAEVSVEEKLAQALALADRIGAWATERGLDIAVVISADPESRDVVFRFHGVRPEEPPWLAEDIENIGPVLERRYRQVEHPPRRR